MESMVLGSPSTSPSSAASGRMPNQKLSYLPPYLMGSSQNSPSNVLSDTPERPGSHRVTWSPDLVHGSPRVSGIPTKSLSVVRERFGGPPIRGLSVESEISNFQDSASPWPFVATTPNAQNVSRIEEEYDFASASQHTHLSASQMDPFYTQGVNFEPSEDMDDRCVTVFGFPPQALSFILQQFSQYGLILNSEVASKGNWIHLLYQSKLQAKKALSKNTKIFNDSIQIGVTPCIDKEVIVRLGADKNAVQQKPSKSFSLDTNLSFPNASVISDYTDPSFVTKTANNPKASMRSLTAAYTSPSSPLKIAAPTTPDTKEDGLINKAWQYVFGW